MHMGRVRPPDAWGRRKLVLRDMQKRLVGPPAVDTHFLPASHPPQTPLKT